MLGQLNTWTSLFDKWAELIKLLKTYTPQQSVSTWVPADVGKGGGHSP